MMGKFNILSASALALPLMLATQAVAQVSQQDFDALKSRVDQIEEDTKTGDAAAAGATAATNTRLGTLEKGWWENTIISGRMYFDITSINHDSNNGSGSVSASDDSSVGFDLKRFYLGIDHNFSNIYSADLTTDVTYDSATAATQIFIKKAYLRAHFSDALDVRLGATDLPWIPFDEGLYNYRQIENALIDRTKYGTSSDWGVHVAGNIPGGILQYAVSVVNGAGYKKPGFGAGTNRSNNIDVEGRVNANYDGFTLAVGGYTGKFGKDTNATPTHNTADRFDVVAAYVGLGFRVGAEYFSADDWNSVTSATSTDKADGYSLFASYQFDPQWDVFGRYDWVNPKTTVVAAPRTSTSVKDNYFNVGIQYTPVQIVNLALAYKHEKADHGVIGTSNGNIGGSVAGSYDEIGLWGQLRW